MENCQINIEPDHLPLHYRNAFTINLMKYIFNTTLTKLTKEMDSLILSHNTLGIIFNGESYTHSSIRVPIVKKVLVDDKYLIKASELVAKKHEVTLAQEAMKSMAAIALAKCKSVADVKLMFPSKVFQECAVTYFSSVELETEYLTPEMLKEFHTQYPDFLGSINQQMLLNLLIY